MSLNQCQFIGNLGQDVTMRYAPSGDAIASFSIAISEKWKDKQGQQQERTEWVNVSVFGKIAEHCGNYLHKGSKVFVQGKFSTRKYQDKDTGKDVYSTSIKVSGFDSKIQFLDPNPNAGGGQSNNGQANNAPQQNQQQNSGAQNAYQAPQQQAPANKPFEDEFDPDIPF